MNATEATAAAQEQTLSALRTTQENIVTFLKPFAAITEPIFDTANALPFSELIPSPQEAVEQWFSFAAEALAAQKEFSLSLLGLIPGSKAQAQAPAPAAKTAGKAV
jgi:hypothetical protein